MRGIVEIELFCNRCLECDELRSCDICDRPTYCRRCRLCNNDACRKEKLLHLKSSRKLLVSQSFLRSDFYPGALSRKSQFDEWQDWGIRFPTGGTTEEPKVDEEGSNKRKRKPRKDPRPVKKRKITRAGRHKPKESGNTFRPPPFEIGVATWNINHINLAAEKLRTICWLFDRHLWIDVLATQEVNLKGRIAFEDPAFVEQLDARGLELRFGPLMRSFSTVGAVVEDDDEEDDEDGDDDEGDDEDSDAMGGDTEEIEVSLLGKKRSVRVAADDRSKLLEVKVDMGWFTEWVRVRPGQPEHYMIVYRDGMFRRLRDEDSWATYDGERLSGDVHYWAKRPYTKRLLTIPCSKETSTFSAELDAQKLPAGLRKALAAKLEDLSGGDVDLSGKIKFGRSSKPKAKVSPWRNRWQLTVASHPDVAILIVEMSFVNKKDREKSYGELDEKTMARRKKVYAATLRKLGVDVAKGQFLVYLQATCWPAWCRPVIVHDLTLEEDPGAQVSLAVVHTTPSGSDLRRSGEYAQVKDIFAFAGKSGKNWILAGDYYLDPESTVLNTRPKDRRLKLFDHAVQGANLDLCISLSGTNQTRIRRAKALKDRVRRVIVDNKQSKTITVLNKRADFFACTKTFAFKHAGILCPTGGIMSVDPNHNALNWWSDISDHCPVGGLFCIEGRPRAWKRFEVTHVSRDFQARIERACKEVDDLHREAVTQLALCLQGLTTSTGLAPVAKKLAVFLHCLLTDPDLERFGPQIAPFDVEAWSAESQEVDVQELSQWLEAVHGTCAPDDERLAIVLRRLAGSNDEEFLAFVGIYYGEEETDDPPPREAIAELVDGWPMIPNGWLSDFGDDLRRYLERHWMQASPGLLGEHEELAFAVLVRNACRYINVLGYALGNVDLLDEDETYEDLTKGKPKFEPIPYIQMFDFQKGLSD